MKMSDSPSGTGRKKMSGSSSGKTSCRCRSDSRPAVHFEIGGFACCCHLRWKLRNGVALQKYSYEE